MSLYTGASCFDKLLKVNNTLQELNLRGNAIGDDGMSLVSDGLQYNKALTKLNVRHCGLSVKGTVARLSIRQSLITPGTSFHAVV